MDTALLIVRLVIGLYLLGHGAQKLFGWFGGPGLQQAAGFMGGMLGFRPAMFWTAVAALGETAGGVLTVLGLLGPAGPLMIAATMAVAISSHAAKGVWAQNGGFELPLTYLVVAIGLALAGPGAYALDAAAGIALPEPATLVAGGVAAIAGVVAAFASRRPTATQAPARAAA